MVLLKREATVDVINPEEHPMSRHVASERGHGA
jgi:hypothetical protein